MAIVEPEDLNLDTERLIQGLADSSILPKGVKNEIELFDEICKGLPFEIIGLLEKRGIVDKTELSEFIPDRTLARRKIEERLSPDESEKLARLLRINEIAAEVFGKSNGHRWLRTPNRAMNGHLPLELVRTEFGARIVETILGRIEHGLYT